MKVGRITEIRSPVSLLPQAYIPDMEVMGRQSFYLLVCSKISFKNVCLNMRDFLDMVCNPLPSNTMKLILQIHYLIPMIKDGRILAAIFNRVFRVFPSETSTK